MEIFINICYPFLNDTCIKESAFLYRSVKLIFMEISGVF